MRKKSVDRLQAMAIIAGLLLIVVAPMLLLQRCSVSRDAAWRELETKGIAFTEPEFVNRVRQRDLETVKLFLAAGINPDAKDEEGTTFLMLAVLAGDIGISEALLKNGASVNARATNDSTALHLAMLVGNYDSARLLLRKGADVNAGNDDGETPLMIAALKGYP